MIVLTTVARGEGSRILDRRRAVARTREEWAALWAAHAGPDSEPPAIDFSSAVVAAAFAGARPSAGYGIEIAGAVEEDGGTRLVVDERAPGAGLVAAQIVTSPFHIVALPRSAGEIRWMNPDGRRSSGGRRRSRTATGLKPNTAAGLAYLAGPFSGGLMLAAEPSDRHVRFHAWQSILALGALGVAMLACYALAFASLFVSANGVALMVNAAFAVWIVLMLVWVWGVWNGFSGGRRRLPLAGAWAERLAAGRRAHASNDAP